MRVSEIKVHLCPANAGRLKAFCSLTFDDALVVRDVKVIGGDDGLFLAMPSRKLQDHCPRCREKNHLKARFCNDCGMRLAEHRHERYRLGPTRLKLHSDIAHPINVAMRTHLEHEVFSAYEREVECSQQPGYVPLPMDTDVPELVFGLKTGAA